MAISVYTGPPGAGKSYALVAQVIVPGVMAGRRVLTNIDGVDPEKVRAFCAQDENLRDPAKIGEVVLFDGRKATEPGFWPTEETGDADTFVKGGDLIVFDEWRLYFPKRGKLPPGCNVEAFLRWHRHLVSPDGVACDVAIGTQLASDVHQDFRGLVERSFKFKKLKAVGLSKAYVWQAFEGHLQPKDGAYQTGNGTYKPEIFELYSSYSTGGKALELQTDKRVGLFSRGLVALVVGLVVMAGVSGWLVWSFFTSGASSFVDEEAAPSGRNVVARSPQQMESSGAVGGRIVGLLRSDQGTRVVLADNDGGYHAALPNGFEFYDGRPVRGTFQGKRYELRDKIAPEPSSRGPLTGLPQGLPQ